MEILTNNKSVLGIKDLDLGHGVYIPQNWFQHVKKESGTADLVAINFLAEIVYWYRLMPVYENDNLIGYTKKFRADKLQKQTKDLVDKFGVSNATAKRALKRLEEQGLITREFRDIPVENGMLYRRQFIDIVPKKIQKITKSYKVKINPPPAQSDYALAQNELTPQLKMSQPPAQNELTPQLKMSQPPAQNEPHTCTTNTENTCSTIDYLYKGLDHVGREGFSSVSTDVGKKIDSNENVASAKKNESNLEKCNFGIEGKESPKEKEKKIAPKKRKESEDNPPSVAPTTIKELTRIAEEQGLNGKSVAYANEFFWYWEGRKWEISKNGAKLRDVNGRFLRFIEKKSPKRAHPAYKGIIEEFDKYYSDNFERAYKGYGTSEGVAFNQLISKITKEIKEKREKDGLDSAEIGAKDIINAFKYILHHLDDGWLKSHLSPQNINAKFDETINSIRNGGYNNKKDSRGMGEQRKREVSEALRKINEMYSDS